MVRASLILLVALTGCVSVQERADRAAAAKGRAEASTPFPDLPAACTVKLERIRPKPEEPRVITLKRVDGAIDNRNRKADDCKAWGVEMKSRTVSSPFPADVNYRPK